MTRRTDDPASVIETRVVHDTHRRATSLLADATGRDGTPLDAVTSLRDFVVAMLRHHHEREDRDLWPILVTAAPSLAEPLATLSREHDHLDEALDGIEASLSSGTAAAVRDLLHAHLSHEEPILFPALRANVSDDEWGVFSRRTVASAPASGSHLLLAFLDEVATDSEIDLLLRHLPPEARAAAPAMRAEAERTLGALHRVRR